MSPLIALFDCFFEVFLENVVVYLIQFSTLQFLLNCTLETWRKAGLLKEG